MIGNLPCCAEEVTYCCHGIDAVNVVVWPAGGKLIGIFLFLKQKVK